MPKIWMNTNISKIIKEGRAQIKNSKKQRYSWFPNSTFIISNKDVTQNIAGDKHTKMSDINANII